MDVRKIMHQRRSCRAFLDKPIAKDTLAEILEDTICAPSAINMQPWQFTVAAGEERLRLSRALMKAYREQNISCGPGATRPLPDEVQQRRIQATEAMAPLLKEMGVTQHVYVNEGSLNFYNAPAALIIAFDSAFTDARLFDMGIAAAYFLLSAHDHGLATCPIGLVCAYEEAIKEVLNIREEFKVALSIAVGFADEASPINRLKTTRDDLDSFVRWYG